MKKLLAALMVCCFLFAAWSPAALAHDRHRHDRHNHHHYKHHHHKHHSHHHKHHRHDRHHDCDFYNGEVIIKAHISDDVTVVWRVPID